jgi:hypothetical protein
MLCSVHDKAEGVINYSNYPSLLPFTYHLLLQGHTRNRLGNAALILPNSEMNYATGLSHILASPSATCFGPIRLSIRRPSVRLTVCRSVLTRNILDCGSVRLLICPLIRTSKHEAKGFDTRAGEATDDNMANAHCMRIPKATNTHSQYVMLTAFARQQWLRERASMLLYTHTARLASPPKAFKTGSGAREVYNPMHNAALGTEAYDWPLASI